MEIFQIFQECVGIGFRVEDWGLGLELQALGVCGLRRFNLRQLFIQEA